MFVSIQCTRIVPATSFKLYIYIQFIVGSPTLPFIAATISYKISRVRVATLIKTLAFRLFRL